MHENNKKRCNSFEIQSIPKKLKPLSDRTNFQSIRKKKEFTDIYAPFSKDPSYVSVYINEIIQHLYESEILIRCYKNNQTDINTTMRGILMDWISDVVDQYSLSPKTLFLTKKIVDIVLSSQKVLIPRGKLQLLGVVALLISSKFEDVNSIEISDLVFISDNSCSHDEIVEWEVLILNILDYRLTIPTEADFLPRFILAGTHSLSDELKSKVHHLAFYYAEMSLIDYTFLKYKSSTVAMSCLCLALATVYTEVWNPTLEHYLPPRSLEFNCIKDLISFLKSCNKKDDYSTHRKYCQEVFANVANLPVPGEVPFFNRSFPRMV